MNKWKHWEGQGLSQTGLNFTFLKDFIAKVTVCIYHGAQYIKSRTNVTEALISKGAMLFQIPGAAEKIGKVKDKNSGQLLSMYPTRHLALRVAKYRRVHCSEVCMSLK